MPVEDHADSLIGAVSNDGFVIVGLDGALLVLTAAGERVERLGREDGIPAGIRAVGLTGDGRVVLDAGSARDGELPGLARFTSAMLTEGAGDWDADALAERLESRGIELGASRGIATDEATYTRVLERLAGAARYAPTGTNKQDTAVVMVTDAARIDHDKARSLFLGSNHNVHDIMLGVEMMVFVNHMVHRLIVKIITRCTLHLSRIANTGDQQIWFAQKILLRLASSYLRKTLR